MLDLRLRGYEWDSQLGRCQVVTTRMGDCLQTDNPFWYIASFSSLHGR